jgi:transposase-like protein
MRYPASEKLEIIRTVEASHLSVKQTLAMIGIPSSTYYDWYARWVDGGLDALADRSPCPKSVWNRIPDDIRERVVEFALDQEDLTPRELAIKYTDEKRLFGQIDPLDQFLIPPTLFLNPQSIAFSRRPI